MLGSFSFRTSLILGKASLKRLRKKKLKELRYCFLVHHTAYFVASLGMRMSTQLSFVLLSAESEGPLSWNKEVSKIITENTESG
jgi:hypothetical protein